MIFHDFQVEHAPRILWIGPHLEDRSQGHREFAVAHEKSLEAGLLRLQNCTFDCVVVLLATDLEAERLIEFFNAQNMTIPFLVQLSQSNVALASLLAHNGVSKVYGPEADSENIFADAGGAALAHHQQFAASEQMPWRKLMVGGSQALRSVSNLIARIASRKSTVLITGESGTGKEVVANALHLAGSRSGRPFQAVNCAAIPEGLLESELFGHVRGAFTGAVQNRVGLFERANGGTVFLDEIGDMPSPLQAKLLRVLQEQQIQPLGGSTPVRIDVRVIAATNTNLERAVAEGRFRGDLFYRLNVIPIHLSPLRDRAEDIPPLAIHFIEKICRAEGMSLKTLTPPALARLCRYSWPGNIRQLKNVIDRAVVTGADDRSVFPGDIQVPAPAVCCVSADLTPESIDTEHGLDFEKTIGAFERGILEKVMRQTRGNKTKAAELLRLGRTTLAAKLRVLSIAA
jgi:DNA-binding NtrC family response regulator